MAIDTLTAKLTIEADFETLQTLRRALADEVTQTDIVTLISDTCATYLLSLGAADFTLDADLSVPRVRRVRRGPRAPIPKVEGGVLTWYDAHAQRTNTVGPVGSSDWFDWLSQAHNKSFRYEAEVGVPFTGQRRPNGQWYAAKRIRGKLHRRYLGLPQNLTAEKLAAVARELAVITESP